MAFRANFWKKFKRIILRKRELLKTRETRSVYSQQIGQLLKNSDNQIVKMTS